MGSGSKAPFPTSHAVQPFRERFLAEALSAQRFTGTYSASRNCRGVRIFRIRVVLLTQRHGGAKVYPKNGDEPQRTLRHTEEFPP